MNIENFKIRKYRKQFKLRQEDLATKINVSTQLIRMYENGTRNPSLEKKRAICNLFNITLNELEGATDKEQLKLEITNKLNTFNLEENIFNRTKIKIIDNFYSVCKNNLQLKDILNNDYSPVNEIQQYIMNFILKNYICESIFTNTTYNEHIITRSFEKFSSLITDFIKSNFRFIESTIEELQYKEENCKNLIPIMKNIHNNWNELNSNAREFIESNTQTLNKKLFGYKIENTEMSMKYEIGNIAILEWTNDFYDNDDVLLCIDDVIKLRRIKKYEYGISIQALNQVFGNEFYTNEEINKNNIKIIGKVIGIKIK